MATERPVANQDDGTLVSPDVIKGRLIELFDGYWKSENISALVADGATTDDIIEDFTLWVQSREEADPLDAAHEEDEDFDEDEDEDDA
jgi:hypothetical protein